ncbi:MAG: histidine--tRNA ligase [Gaiellales bacterium]
MSGAFQRPPGTRDWFREEAARRRWVVDHAIGVFERAGFTEIVTPTFEDTGVYARTSGETSDVVRKEMYTFTDRGDRSLTLRPLGTAGVMRAYIENGMSRLPQPVKQYYLAGMFRYNKVQRGRYREHYQFGVEAIGSDDPAVDAEVIALQGRWYDAIGARSVLELNSIGDANCRPAYVELLVAYLDQHLDELCEECRERRRSNPLRVLDCKNPGCQDVLRGAPRITDHLCEECAAHFAAVREHLDARGVAYELVPSLVRGLDYYMRTTWEFTSDELGAQAAIGAGGRYDGLSEQLGGPPAPGVGFGAGVERILEIVGESAPAGRQPWICFAVPHAPARPRVFAIMDAVRAAGRRAEPVFGNRSLRRMLEHAGRQGAHTTVIVGEDEWSRGAAAVRDMNTGQQREVALDELAAELS